MMVGGLQNSEKTMIFRQGSWLCVLCLCTLLCCPGNGERKRPNFIVLLTDDQDLTLMKNQGMPFTVDMMAREGANLTNFFSNSPVCCPSRVTLFSGRYAHQWHTTAAFTCMHMNIDDSSSFWEEQVPVYLQRLGYSTGAFGKILNLEIGNPYCREGSIKPIPGYNSSFALCNEMIYYQNRFNVNGSLLTTGKNPKDYMTSAIGNRSVEFLENSLVANRPFFLYVGPHAPHLPATPAPWYMNEFSNLAAPRTPNYNASGADHHYLLQIQQAMSPSDAQYSDELFRNRSRTILSVDDIIKSLVDMLIKYNQLDNTYIIWTSDHGYQLGQFRLPCEKEQPYDNHIRVPFFIRGPNIPPKSTFDFMASIVDIAPTILQLVNGSYPSSMDGKSFAKQLTAAVSGTKDKHLIEYWSVGIRQLEDHYIDLPNNTFIGVRLLNTTHNYLYVEFYATEEEVDFTSPNEYELFDLHKDPWQLKNLYNTSAMDKELVGELQAYLRKQVKCSGQAECVGEQLP